MKLIITTALLFLLFSCSSRRLEPNSRGVRDELQTKSDTYRIIFDPKDQYNKAVQMVSGSTVFSENQKVQLNALIGEYAIKSQDLKIKERQYRAVLINGLIEPGKSGKTTSKMIKNDLAKINNESAENLEEFIKEFQEIAGGSGISNEGLILQTLDI